MADKEEINGEEPAKTDDNTELRHVHKIDGKSIEDFTKVSVLNAARYWSHV